MHNSNTHLMVLIVLTKQHHTYHHAGFMIIHQAHDALMLNFTFMLTHACDCRQLQVGTGPAGPHPGASSPTMGICTNLNPTHRGLQNSPMSDLLVVMGMQLMVTRIMRLPRSQHLSPRRRQKPGNTQQTRICPSSQLLARFPTYVCSQGSFFV